MAFTVNDLQDLLTLLRAHPEWRAEVRKEVLGDELLMLPDLVRQNSEDIQKLTERMDQLTLAVTKLTQHASQVDIDMAELKGDTLEVWYRDHPEALAQRRQLRKIWLPLVTNLDLVDAALESGKLTADQVDALYNVDLIVGGREGSGDDARDAFLVVEVSNKIDQHDITRAVEQADLLRSIGCAAYPVVAGRTIDPRTRQQADELGVEVHLRVAQARSA